MLCCICILSFCISSHLGFTFLFEICLVIFLHICIFSFWIWSHFYFLFFLICILSLCVMSYFCILSFCIFSHLCFILFVNCLFVFCPICNCSFWTLSHLHFVLFLFCLFVFCHFLLFFFLSCALTSCNMTDYDIIRKPHPQQYHTPFIQTLPFTVDLAEAGRFLYGKLSDPLVFPKAFIGPTQLGTQISFWL